MAARFVRYDRDLALVFGAVFGELPEPAKPVNWEPM
jgi:hypothetical protein